MALRTPCLALKEFETALRLRREGCWVARLETIERGIARDYRPDKGRDGLDDSSRGDGDAHDLSELFGIAVGPAKPSHNLSIAIA
jgi:hypothetical protein